MVHHSKSQPMKLDLLSIITGALGSTLLTKLLELFWKTRTERGMRKAQIRHTIIDGDHKLVDMYTKSLEHLANRINQLETQAEEMRNTIAEQNQMISQQNGLIAALKGQVENLIQVNQELQHSINANR